MEFSRLDDAAKQELWAVLALRHTQGIGPRRAWLLVEAYGGAYEAVNAALRSPDAWVQRKLIPSDVARAFTSEAWRTGAQKEWQALGRSGCHFLLWNDPGFPPLLGQIPDAPLVLYYNGDRSLFRSPAVAVVGARDCTREGLAVAAYIARELSKAGVTVISGMAKGIDRAAHIAAMEGPGKSVAVLGTGMDVPYPPSNADLYEALMRQGLLVSELGPGTPPAARHFPIRNRIISALSLGVLVVEAAARSGSLITARLALEQGRDVFAVPGHTMAAVSEGCRQLIRDGAKAVFTADDILVELVPQLSATARQSLETRRADTQKQRHSPRKRAHGLDTGLLRDAESVLPPGPLSWTAPPPAARISRVGPTVPAPRSNGGRAAERQAPQAKAAPASTPEEARILSVLGPEAVHMDELGRSLDMDSGRLSSLLTLLEVRGLVKRMPGMRYSLPAR